MSSSPHAGVAQMGHGIFILTNNYRQQNVTFDDILEESHQMYFSLAVSTWPRLATHTLKRIFQLEPRLTHFSIKLWVKTLKPEFSRKWKADFMSDHYFVFHSRTLRDGCVRVC